MKTIDQSLSANTPARFIGGKFFQIMDSAAAVNLIFFNDSGQPFAKSEGVLSGLIYRGKFAAVEVVSTTAQNIKLGISDNDGEYNRLSGNVDALIDIGDTLANGTGTAGAASPLVIAANASTKALHVRNTGTNDIYLGASGVTTANGATILAPGEEIIIVQGAKAAWYGYASANTNLAFTRIT